MGIFATAKMQPNPINLPRRNREASLLSPAASLVAGDLRPRGCGDRTAGIAGGDGSALCAPPAASLSLQRIPGTEVQK